MNEDFYNSVVKNLDESIPEYIRKVGKFQYENEEFMLTNHYRADEYQKCEVCGHYPIREVFEVTSATKTLKVGNECIDTISSQKISQWFSDYQQKKMNLESNKNVITIVHYILEKYEDGTLKEYGIFISKIGIKRLRKMLDRLCKGWNPTEEQVKLYECYRRRIVRAVEKYKQQT